MRNFHRYRRGPVTAVFAALILLALAGYGGAVNAQSRAVNPVLDPYQHRQQFVGQWLMTRRTADRGEAVWLVNRDQRGTYRRVTRRTSPTGLVTQYEDVGRWGVVNDVLFMMTRGRTRQGQSALDRADPADPYSYDAFRITSSSPDRLSLLSLHSGQAFSERRVASDFRLP